MNLDDEPVLKFEDCAACALRFQKKSCRSCDAGELFEDGSIEAVDEVFRERRY